MFFSSEDEIKIVSYSFLLFVGFRSGETLWCVCTSTYSTQTHAFRSITDSDCGYVFLYILLVRGYAPSVETFISFYYSF